MNHKSLLHLKYGKKYMYTYEYILFFIDLCTSGSIYLFTCLSVFVHCIYSSIDDLSITVTIKIGKGSLRRKVSVCNQKNMFYAFPDCVFETYFTSRVYVRPKLNLTLLYFSHS